MTKINNISQNIDNNKNSVIVNSLDEIKNFLSEKGVLPFAIEKMAQSFMAKIQPKTKIILKDNILQIGESILNLGENIYSKTINIIENTKNHAMELSTPKISIKRNPKK